MSPSFSDQAEDAFLHKYNFTRENSKQNSLYSALFKIAFKLKISSIPPLPSILSLNPIVLRGLIADKIKASNANFNNYKHLPANVIDDPAVFALYCEDIDFGRMGGSLLEIAAFCDIFACEIILHVAGSSIAILFPSKFYSCKYRATLYGRAVIVADKRVEMYHHVTSEEGIAEAEFYSKLRNLDSTTAVMAGSSWESQSHLSQYRQRATSAPRGYPDVTSAQMIAASPSHESNYVNGKCQTGVGQDISHDPDYTPPADDTDASAGQVAPEVAAEIEVYTHHHHHHHHHRRRRHHHHHRYHRYHHHQLKTCVLHVVCKFMVF